MRHMGVSWAGVGGRCWKNVRLVFFLGFLGLGREPPLFGARASGRGSGFRTRQGGRGRTPRVHAGLAHVSTIHRSRSRLSSRVTRQEERGLVRGLGENPPFLQGLFFSRRGGRLRAGSRATRRTVLPRRSRGMRGRKDRGGRGSGGGGGEVVGWVEERRPAQRRGPQRLRGLVVVARRFSEVRSWRPTSGRGDFERNRRRPVSTGRPRDESRASDERTPGNFPDTSKLAIRVFWHPGATSFRSSFRRTPRTDEEGRATCRDGRAGWTRRTRRRMRTRRSSRGELSPPGPDPRHLGPTVDDRAGAQRRWSGSRPCPRHHRGPSAVRTRALRRAGADVPPRGRS